MKVSRVKIRIDNSDGTWSEGTYSLPHDIADFIQCELIDWKNTWVATTKAVEDFQESEKAFTVKSKQQPTRKETSEEPNEVVDELDPSSGQ